MSDEVKKDEADDEVARIFSAYASFFHNTPSGREILADLKKSLDGPTYRPGMSVNDTIWLEGRRSVYLSIVASVGEGIERIESAGRKREPVLTNVLTEPLD
jgi:hypothetical protein